MNGPYVRRMIPEPGDTDREVPVPATFHEQTDDELTVAEIKQMEELIMHIQPFFSVFLKTLCAAFKLTYSTTTNNTENFIKTLVNRQIAQPGLKMGQDRQLRMVGGQCSRCSSKSGVSLLGLSDSVVVCSKGRKQESQIQVEEFDLMAAAADLDEIEETDQAEVHNYDNCYDNEIFNMFTQEEQYTELLEPIPEPHQEQQNDSNVISDISSVEQEGEQ
ncbi:hypothetical protein Tco_0151473 [Tanacetum coccineum]